MLRKHLVSWNEGATKSALLSFVKNAVTPGSLGFIPECERVAVFDNDGTLWCEKPVPVQTDFLLKRLRELAELDPTLRSKEPYRAAVERDYSWLGGAVTKHYMGCDYDLEQMSAGLVAAYAGTTAEQFAAYANDFLSNALHPQLNRLYRSCTYVPMLELLRLLESQGFASYIVSGGGRDFVRATVEDSYGLGPERVIGSTVALRFSDREEMPTIVHDAQLGLFDDGPVKPVQIWSTIGRRPVLGFGNANGDIPMLRFCGHGAASSLCLLLNHDDGEREYAYQAGAEEAQRNARKYGWLSVSMRADWKTVFSAL
jgi:phosphoserine phosphatase